MSNVAQAIVAAAAIKRQAERHSDRLTVWNQKRLNFWALCCDELQDSPELLPQALRLIGELGSC